MSHDPFFIARPIPDYKLEEAQRARWAAAERDAEYTFLALRYQVEALEKSAAAEGNEVGLVVPFSTDIVHVREVGWEGRTVIFIVGTLRDKPVRLVLHHSQLQMLLVPVKPETGEPARVLYLVPKADDADVDESDEPETDAP